VLVLCPTHQAKHQFTKKLEGIEGVHLATVASYLTQFPISTETGELKFMRGGFGGVSHDVMVIDETSMVSEYEMGELLKGKRECLVIFLGDFAQLRPVMKKQGELYKQLKTFTLHHQHRNASDILKLCQKVRTEVVYPHKSSGPIRVHRNRAKMVKAFLEDITSSKRPYDVCFLAYRNTVVSELQARVHLELYGTDPFVVGQYLRLDQGCLIGNNGSIVKVKKLKGSNPKTFDGLRVRVHELRLYNLDTQEYGFEHVVSMSDQALLKAKLEELYDKSGKAFKRDKESWEYYQTEISRIRQLTFVSSPFAQTIHKSQGRSIPRVYVDTLDVSRGNDKRRLLYVAYSRAMDLLSTIRVL